MAEEHDKGQGQPSVPAPKPEKPIQAKATPASESQVKKDPKLDAKARYVDFSEDLR